MVLEVDFHGIALFTIMLCLEESTDEEKEEKVLDSTCHEESMPGPIIKALYPTRIRVSQFAPFVTFHIQVVETNQASRSHVTGLAAWLYKQIIFDFGCMVS